MAATALIGAAAKSAIAKGAGTAAVSQTSKKGPHYAAALSPYGRAERKLLKEDIKKLQQGGFGPGEAEKRLMLNEASRAIREGTAELDVDLKRSAAAMGGYGRSGLQAAAAGRLAKARADAMAQARLGVEQQARQAEVSERDIARARVSAARDRVYHERKGTAQDGGLAAGVMAGTTKYRELVPESTRSGGAAVVNERLA
ncbi:MAG: hypothetical protein Unbinned7358contig1000_22 [Prokaryotic dsDNA virus sp.]|nr:MAG: hypothetical protein Unbinned7358contig1000_22 [Prokaryotic dsDNA virus sp.]|tara:strand:+ start:22002 stop:22601 length:600 start_codon:yes stop_codon:yes gene_type:complete